MELDEALLKRRSIRKYTDRQLTEEEVDALMHAAMSGPSGCNYRPWRFVVVQNPETLQRIRDASPHGKYNAPCAIIVIGDKNISKNMWGNDCGAATENILLKATDLGLGTCWCAAYPYEDRNKALKEIVHANESEEAYALIYVGEPAEEPEPRDQYDSSKITRM